MKKKRNVIFYNNCYYNNYYLAKALRKRGWDAVTVSLAPPDSSNNLYYHGEDVNLYSKDPLTFRKNMEDFFENAKRNFDFAVFYGDTAMSFFPGMSGGGIPEDLLEWILIGKRIGYTKCGCSSLVSQSAYSKWLALDGEPYCRKCIYYKTPDICSDCRNLEIGRKIYMLCDVIFAEGPCSVDWLDNEKRVNYPVITALDPEIWQPELEIPEEFIIEKDKDEILIFHGVGNYDIRTQANGNNIKGTKSVFEAVERLNHEGIKNRIIFKTGMKNVDLRYIQAQADIVVDQLNAGVPGAISREGMMLGKPTVCYVNRKTFKDGDMPANYKELPLVNARENTIYNVLKELILDKKKRLEIGRMSREYALKWHSADKCAERFEIIYDNMTRQESEESILRRRYFEKLYNNPGFRHFRKEPVNQNIPLYSAKKDFFTHRVKEFVKNTGKSRIAFYGAGKHTAEIAPFDDYNPAKIICIFDDNPQCEEIAGMKIANPQDIGLYNIEALVISSDTHQDFLYERAMQWVPERIEVLKLYKDDEVRNFY